MSNVGIRVKELRLQKKMTQQDLAKGICTPSMISQIEGDRARASYRILTLLAERLDVPVDHLLADNDKSQDVSSTYQTIRALLASQQHAAALPQLEELLEMPRASVSHIDLIYDIAVCCIHTGDLTRAEMLLDQVFEDAFWGKDYDRQARVMNDIGLVMLQRKRFEVAFYQWKKALATLEKARGADRVLKGTILHNMACAKLKTGRKQEAIRLHMEAAACFEGADNLVEMGQSLMAATQAYQADNRWRNALNAAYRALSIFEAVDILHVKAKIDMATAIASGEELTEPLGAVMRRFAWLGKKEDVGVARVERAKAKLQAGDAPGAEQDCWEGIAALPDGSLELARGYEVLARIQAEKRMPKQALVYFQKAADLYRRLNELWRWEDAMVAMSHVYRETQDLKRAVAVLQDVRRSTREVLERRQMVL